MKTAILYLFRPMLGKLKFQRFFEKALVFVLRGLNYVNGADFRASGELNVLKIIGRHYDKKTKLIVFDVGANEGHYTNAMIEHLSFPSRIVFAFEPVQSTYKKLEANTRGHAELINKALGDKEAAIPIYFNSKKSVHSSLVQRDMSHWGDEFEFDSSEVIGITTFESFCRERGIDHVHFVKIDVEGHELSVFKGMGSYLTDQKIDFIQFEFGTCIVDAKYFFKDVYYQLTPNYKIYRVVKDGLHPIHKYSEYLEIFLTTNYLAVSNRINFSA